MHNNWNGPEICRDFSWLVFCAHNGSLSQKARKQHRTCIHFSIHIAKAIGVCLLDLLPTNLDRTDVYGGTFPSLAEVFSYSSSHVFTLFVLQNLQTSDSKQLLH